MAGDIPRGVLERALCDPFTINRDHTAREPRLAMLCNPNIHLIAFGQTVQFFQPSFQFLRFDDQVVPIIMITAYGDAETKAKALEGGADALFTKPIDFASLRSEIDTRVSNGLPKQTVREWPMSAIGP